jgi:hypothetical protein
MTLTVLELEVGNPADGSLTEKVEFIVDSGIIHSVVPAPVLRRLGIKPFAEDEFSLGDGSKIVRKRGCASFRYGSKVGGGDVIFGEEGDATLLGALTLASLGFVLDPLRRELKPLPMILAASNIVSATRLECGDDSGNPPIAAVEEADSSPALRSEKNELCPQKTHGAEKQRMPPISASLGLAILTAILGRIYKKIRFPNKETELRGFSILLRSGGMEAFGNGVYGLSSKRQIGLLEEKAVPFEIVNE